MSSIKAITGHGLGAASAFEAVACVQALREQIAPPTWNFTRADPACPWDAIPNEPRELELGVVLSNAYAFGGANASLVLRAASLMAVVLGAGWIAPDRDFDVAEHLALRGLRPLARASHLARVAAARALRRPEPLPAAPERCAVVLGTRFASIEPLVEFNRVAVTDGPSLVNPSSFPNVVVNAHAGYLGILFGLAGPNVTLCGEAAGLDALGHAIDLLELGRADAVLAGGVEAYGETLFEGLRRATAEEPEEAAAFLVLGRDGAGPTLARTDVDALAEGPTGPAAGALAAVRALG